MKPFGILCGIAFVLVVVGGINWGLLGLFDFNLVSAIFGEGTLVTRLIYILVGVASIYLVVKKILKKKEM